MAPNLRCGTPLQKKRGREESQINLTERKVGGNQPLERYRQFFLWEI